jgi:hypothetical protein
MAYTTINKSTDYFNTVTYTGNGTAIGSGGNAITGVGFQPDWLWVKDRSIVNSHNISDVIRGASTRVYSDLTNAEDTNSESVNSFDADGFTVGNNVGVNTNTNNYVAWNWLASNTTASNTDGSITSTVSANTTSGFSIGTYTGTGADATVGHGLGVAPDMIFVKCTSTAHDWGVYHSSLGSGQALYLNLTNASSSATGWQNTDPTSTVFSIDNAANSLNQSGQSFVFYAFASKKGYSKIGSFTGNGNADGTFIYTGFRPAFILVRASNLVTNWHLYDNKRDPINPADIILRANANNAEATSSEFAYDFVSNGFKARSSGAEFNGSGNTFIYYAVGQSIVGSNNVPATAR